MTCIVGVEREGVLYMSSDSAASDPSSLSLRILHDPKVFINDQMLIGCCSSLRVQQLLQHSLVPPDKPERKDDLAYLVTDFMDAVRATQKDKGSMKKEDELETQDSHFLIGYNGRLYYVEDDFQVYRTNDPWAAVGCGADLALGALYATKNSAMAPQERIIIALEAAVEYSAGVRPPFHHLKLEHT